MFKVIVLCSLYNLSDDQVEYQIRDRPSFMRFLGSGIEATIPDAKTVWLYRDRLADANVIDLLFADFVGATGSIASISISRKHVLGRLCLKRRFAGRPPRPGGKKRKRRVQKASQQSKIDYSWLKRVLLEVSYRLLLFLFDRIRM